MPIPGFSFSLASDADHSSDTGYPNLFVDINTTFEGIICAAGDAPIGVKQNKPKAGEPMTIVHNGIVFVRAASLITAGDVVAVGTSGRAKTAASTERPAGRALTNAGGADELIACLLFPQSADLA